MLYPQGMPEGFLCKCGRFIKFPPFVYSNWNVPIIFTSRCCKIDYRIVGGVATPKDAKPKATTCIPTITHKKNIPVFNLAAHRLKNRKAGKR